MAKLAKPILAAVLTAAVFLTMRFLIVPTGDGPGQADPPPVVDITRQQRNEISRPRERFKPAKPQSKQLPPLQRMVQTHPTVDDGGAIATATIPAVVKKPGGGGPIISDRRATPLVRVPPQYPLRAKENGVEGWVMVEFTINLAGGVEDVVVIDAEPPTLFNRAVIRAIQRWKYQPKIVNGKPIPQYRMRDMVRFQLQ